MNDSMSFAFASFNEYGIVMSADRCITGTNGDGLKYNVTNTARKLFLTKQGFSITYTGCSSVGGIPVESKIVELLEALSSSMELPDFFAQFVAAMAEFCKERIIFLVAGYHENVPQIYTATTINTEIVLMENIGYSGEDGIAKAVICSVKVPYQSMTIQDRMDFHRFITRTIAGLQSYSNYVPTVSESCDVVALGKCGVLFSSFSELH